MMETPPCFRVCSHTLSYRGITSQVARLPATHGCDWVQQWVVQAAGSILVHETGKYMQLRSSFDSSVFLRVGRDSLGVESLPWAAAPRALRQARVAQLFSERNYLRTPGHAGDQKRTIAAATLSEFLRRDRAPSIASLVELVPERLQAVYSLATACFVAKK